MDKQRKIRKPVHRPVGVATAKETFTDVDDGYVPS
jgi:hypothetical protein